jgi:1-acyl-sn-glycerol-3-phosphate acyltransferase
MEEHGMIKLLWYSYFALYMAVSSFSRLKVRYLRKKDNAAADIYAYKMMQKMCKFILKKSQTTVEVKGLENIPQKACLFVSNHQAIFDAFLLIAHIDKLTGFIAKVEISRIPIVGGWLKEIHTVYLDRSSVKDGIKAINQGAEEIKKGHSMIIFPEGTRSLSSEIGEFKKGSLKVAMKANAPVVPVTIDGTYRVLEVGNKVRGNHVKIHFHEAIYTDRMSKEDAKNITQITHDIVSQGLKNMLDN